MRNGRKIFAGVFCGWDNTPRNKHGVMVSGFSVEKFAEYMKILVQRARKEEKPVIFIKHGMNGEKVLFWNRTQDISIESLKQ